MIVFLGLFCMAGTAIFTWAAYTSRPGAGQSPRSAIVEAWLNILIGFSINFVMNILVIPLAMDGGVMTLANNWWMGWVFTFVSILRQYALRRWFNARLHAVALRVSGEVK